MDFDVQKNYDFESNCIEFLREKIDNLHQLDGNWLANKKNRDAFGFILKKTAQQGFLRTHAFLVNWLGEMFNYGELVAKDLHNIIAQLPWNRDQVKKYLDSLVDNGLLHSSRDSRGKKVYLLSVEKESKNGFSHPSNQLLRVKDYLKVRKRIPEEKLSEIRELTVKYYTKKKKANELLEQLAIVEKTFLPAEEEQLKQLAEEIATIYLQKDKNHEEKIIKNIEAEVKENPALLFSLIYKEKK